MRAALRLAAVLALALAPACKCARPGAEPPDAGDEDQVHPVYDLHTPPDPLAQRLCQALHALPGQRRAQCCSGGGASLDLAPQCTAILSAALKLGAVTLAPEKVDACAAALGAAYAGCDWVGPNDVPLPAACSGLLVGTLPAGARCRSALECQGELRCAGAGPTDTGRCAPAGPPGMPCELSVDSLASYTRQDLARSHPECEGFCQRRACRQALGMDGGSCLLDAQCPRGAHCGNGACVPGATARLGEPCSSGGCEAPLRCIQDTCRAPGHEGAPCTGHRDCLGACIPGDGGARCGNGCAFR